MTYQWFWWVTNVIWKMNGWLARTRYKKNCSAPYDDCQWFRYHGTGQTSFVMPRPNCVAIVDCKGAKRITNVSVLGLDSIRVLCKKIWETAERVKFENQHV
jgi:hypothetical protein